MKTIAAGIVFLLALVNGQLPAVAQSDVATGLVTKVDEFAQKITIKHERLKTLDGKTFDMEDGMTMVFRAGDPSMLRAIKPGDKVRFVPGHINGQFIITKIQKIL